MKKTIAVIVIIIGIICDLVIFTELRKLEKTDSIETASNTFDILEIQLKSILKNRFFVSEAMSSLVKLKPDLNPLEFSAFAETLLTENPPVRAIQYADSDAVVRYVYPTVGNEITISNPMHLLNNPGRAGYVKKAINERRATLQPPFRLRQGGLGMVLRNPIFIGDRFAGLSIIVLDVNRVFDEVYSSNQFDEFEIGYYREDGTFFFGTELPESNFLSRMIPVADTFWEVRLLPHNREPDFQLYTLLALVFLLFTGVAVILYTLLGQRQYLKREIEIETERLKEANIKLNSQINLRIRSEEQIKNLLEEKEILLKEVHHRLKNNLTSIISLLKIQVQDIGSEEAREHLVAAINRLESLQGMYRKLLNTENYMELNSRYYFTDLLDSIKKTIDHNDRIDFITEVDDLDLDTKQLFPLGIIANELITNAVKHAFADGKEGVIRVIIKDYKQYFTFSVADNGESDTAVENSSKPVSTSGIGLSLVELLVKQLNGKIKINRENGYTFSITVPKIN